jgi:Skp family chaperone for outer membrane proteins
MDYKDGETEWDLRQARLELLGKMSQEKALAYRRLLHDKSKENLRYFFHEVKAMWKEVKLYADKENDKEKELMEEIDEKIESLDEKLGEKSGIDDFYNLDSNVEVFQELDEVDDDIKKMRMKVGLDIPRKKKYDPENAGVAGLEG